MEKIKITISERKIIASSRNSNEFNLVMILLILNSSKKGKRQTSLGKLNYIYSLIQQGKLNENKGLQLLPAWDIDENIKALILQGASQGYWGVVKGDRVSFVMKNEGEKLLDVAISEEVFKELSAQIDKVSLNLTQTQFERHKLVWK